MGIPEAARRLKIADADIREVVAHEDGGFEVRGVYGAVWVITEDDEVFAYGAYHPHTKSLRRYEDRQQEQDGDEQSEEEQSEDETEDVKDDKGREVDAADGGDEVNPETGGKLERSDDELNDEPTDGEPQDEPEHREAEDEQRDTAVDEPPQGTISEVLDWVGDDEDRAQRALDAEQAADVPRKRLIAELEKRIGG